MLALMEAVAVGATYYTTQEIERMLRRWLRREREYTTHGRLTYRPRVDAGGTHDRWASVHVSEEFLTMCDLQVAWKRLPNPYKRILLLWYGPADASAERIVEIHRDPRASFYEPTFTKHTLHQRRKRGLALLAKWMGPK